MNFLLAVLPNTDASRLVRDPAEAATDFHSTSAPFAEGAYVAQAGPHAVLVDATAELFSLGKSSWIPDGTALVTLGGTSDVYGFEVFGTSPRERVVEYGDITADTGTPVPAEEVLAGDDQEDAHLELAARLAGITVGELFGLEWRPVAPNLL